MGEVPSDEAFKAKASGLLPLATRIPENQNTWKSNFKTFFRVAIHGPFLENQAQMRQIAVGRFV